MQGGSHSVIPIRAMELDSSLPSLQVVRRLTTELRAMLNFDPQRYLRIQSGAHAPTPRGHGREPRGRAAEHLLPWHRGRRNPDDAGGAALAAPFGLPDLPRILGGTGA